jgi:hypothetical protein
VTTRHGLFGGAHNDRGRGIEANATSVTAENPDLEDTREDVLQKSSPMRVLKDVAALRAVRRVNKLSHNLNVGTDKGLKHESGRLQH